MDESCEPIATSDRRGCRARLGKGPLLRKAHRVERGKLACFVGGVIERAAVGADIGGSECDLSGVRREQHWLAGGALDEIQIRVRVGDFLVEDEALVISAREDKTELAGAHHELRSLGCEVVLVKIHRLAVGAARRVEKRLAVLGPANEVGARRLGIVGKHGDRGNPAGVRQVEPHQLVTADVCREHEPILRG